MRRKTTGPFNWQPAALMSLSTVGDPAVFFTKSILWDVNMSEWDFLWDLKGAELEEAMKTGATEADWDYIERCELIDRWYIQLEELKHCKSVGLISKSQYAKGKCCPMESALILDVTDGELDGIEIYDLVEQWAELKYKRSSADRRFNNYGLIQEAVREVMPGAKSCYFLS